MNADPYRIPGRDVSQDTFWSDENQELSTYEKMIQTSITADLELRTDAHRGASFLCFFDALQNSSGVALKVQCPLIEGAFLKS